MPYNVADVKPNRFAKVTIAKSFRTVQQASITGQPINTLVPQEMYECHGRLHTDGNDVVVVSVGSSPKDTTNYRGNINNVVALEYLE